MKTIRFLVSLLSVTFFCTISCNKEEESPAGTDEILDFYYFYETTPIIDSLPFNQSHRISIVGASAIDNGNKTVITFKGMRVQTDNANYSITNFKVLEDKGDGLTLESEFETDHDSIKTDIACILLLDMSESVELVVDKLKSYAKDFAMTIVNSSPNSLVSVIFFNTKENITSTPFYNQSNIIDLLNSIDAYSGYLDDTALFKATNVAIDKLDSLSFKGEKSLVIFSDGGNNDSDFPGEQKTKISNSKTIRYSIGLRGKDFKEPDLKFIASNPSNFVVAEVPEDLKGIFKLIALGVISVYDLHYTRSNAKQGQYEKIKIRLNIWADKIK